MLRNFYVCGIIILFVGGFFVPISISELLSIDENKTGSLIGLITYNEILDPQQEWNRTYGGEKIDLFKSIIELPDGNFIVRGDRDFHLTGAGYRYGDGWILKLDSEGDLVWDKKFGETGTDFCNALIQTSDGGYVLGFTTDSFSSGDWDLRLIKTDSNFKEEWSKEFIKTNDQVVHCVQKTDDDGFVVAGPTLIENHPDLWLSKIDSDGNEIWNNVFGGEYLDYGNDVIQTEDGGYLIVGISESFGVGKWDGWILKTDSDGNEEWNKTYGGNYDDKFQKVRKTNDGGFIIAGTIQIDKTIDNKNDDIWLIKLDHDYNLEWERTFGELNFHERGNSIQQTKDSGFIVVGSHFSVTTSVNKQGLMLKVDSNGYEEWNTTFGGSEDETCNNIIQTTDGGYLVVGKTNSYGSGEYDGWIVKFSSGENQKPIKPNKIIGPSSGKIDKKYTFFTSTVDPDGDDVYYLVDWDDGSDSGWHGPFVSGEECNISHIWNEKGSYEIRVKAKDLFENESPWSDPSTFRINKGKSVPITNILKLFNLIKYNFPLLSFILINLEEKL